MKPAYLYIALALALLVAIFVIVRALRGGSRLQRRLFLLMLLLSLLPALGILVVTWSRTERNLRLVESAAMEVPFESALELARVRLESEKRETLEMARALAGELRGSDSLPPLPEKSGARLLAPSGRILQESGNTAPEATGNLLPAGEEPGVERLDAEEGSFLVARVPVLRGGESLLLEVYRPLDPELALHLDKVGEGVSRARQLRLVYGKLLRGDTLLTLGLLVLLLVFVSLYLSRHFARRIGVPVAELARGTGAVASGDLDHRVEVRAIDELGDLVGAFNRMTAQLKESKLRLLRSERIAAWQGVARRLAHEIKNPLTPIHLSIHRIQGKVDDPTVLECLDTVLEETRNLKRLADEFSLYARLPAPEKTRFRPREMLEHLTELYARKGRLDVRWDSWGENVTVYADEGQIRQVFSNLVKNAVEAMGGRGTLTLASSVDGDRLRIVVDDTGPGLGGRGPEIFEPDFTTKSSGTGLGLAIARKIVEDHGGGIEAFDRPQGGARFVVELPGVDVEASGEPSPSAGSGRAGEETS
jgi:nitrogen fixation/metabolism regulation signal transduction histidine kinase